MAHALTGAVVCDASVISAIAFGEPGLLEASRLLHARRLLAPRLLRYELAQVALNKSSPASAAEGARILEGFAAALRLPIRLIEPEWVPVVELARAHGLSTYDASYLQIALALGVPLATLDGHLGKVGEELGLRAVPQHAG